MARYDLLRKELAVTEANVRQLRIVGVAVGRAQGSRLENGTVLFEEPLVVPQMIREDYLVSLEAHTCVYNRLTFEIVSYTG